MAQANCTELISRIRYEIGPDDHLAIVDRVTVRIAGMAAQNLFKCATDEWIGMSDYMRIGALVSQLWK